MTKVKVFSGRIMRDVSNKINDWLSKEPVTVEFVNQAYKQSDMEWNILIFYREVTHEVAKKPVSTGKKTTKKVAKEVAKEPATEEQPKQEQSNDEVK